jgi:LytS/YehU family sensor histidine kinase
MISLVENAIKHGIEPSAHGGTVLVRARREGDALAVAVEDTGRGLGTSTRGGHGVGLANVRDRLAALYGTKARFTLTAGEPTGARAVLTIPFEAVEAGVEDVGRTLVRRGAAAG